MTKAALILSTFLIALGCRTSRPAVGAHQSVDSSSDWTRWASVTNDQMVISGLRLGMTKGEVRDSMGAPVEVSASYDSITIDDTVTTFSYPSITVEFIGQHVEYVTCFDAGCATAAGVRVGDSLPQVESIYGRGHPGYDQSSPMRIYPSKSSDCGLTFQLQAERVSAIRLWCDNS